MTDTMQTIVSLADSNKEISSKALYKAIKDSDLGISQNRVYTVYMRPEFAGSKRGHWKVDPLVEFIKEDIESGFTKSACKNPGGRGAKVRSVPAHLPKKSDTPTEAPEQSQALKNVISVETGDVYIPEVCKTYVRWGSFSSLSKIIDSHQFFPVYISGMSGNGKTFMVEQACAKLKREFVRVQITPETDEDDLIGGFRLLDGDTVFSYGPVIKAMKAGAVLLIDELDRGTNKIMCLQGVLEGKPVLLKKTGEVVFPAPGFTVIATANTKGQGSSDGRYSGAQIIDDAFLERFIINIDQPFPNMAQEKNIITRHMEKYDCMDEKFALELAGWSDVIHKTFNADGVDDIVSTRRLCHIVHTFSIFRDKKKAIDMCLTRYNEETREAFTELFDKLSENDVTWDSAGDE